MLVGLLSQWSNAGFRLLICRIFIMVLRWEFSQCSRVIFNWWSIHFVINIGRHASIILSNIFLCVEAALNMNDYRLKSYSNWKIAGIIIALLKSIFNIYFGQYFELLLLIVHLPDVYNIVIGKKTKETYSYSLFNWKSSFFYYLLISGMNLVSCLSWLIGILTVNRLFFIDFIQ